MITIGIVLLSIIIYAGFLALGGLICWGIGCLIVNVFDIAYTWTFLHGLCVEIVLVILGGLFRRN